MRRRILCNILAFLFSILIVMPITYMIADRDVPIELQYVSISTPVSPGQEVSVTWHIKMFRACDGFIQRKIVDSGGFNFVADKLPFQSLEHMKKTSMREGTFSKKFTM